MLEQELALAFESSGDTVRRGREERIRAERARERARDACTRRRIGPLDGDQHHARDGAIAQLVDQEALLGGGRGRKEGREVGDEARLRDLQRAKHQPREPEPDREAARRDHFASGEIAITERSPSAWKISTLRTPEASPAKAMRSTSVPSAGSRGRRRSRQLDGLPSSCAE